MYPNFFDGENLVGARRKPVKLVDSSRLVYAPHIYGPGVKLMPYMNNEEFPENSELVWQVGPPDTAAAIPAGSTFELRRL